MKLALLGYPISHSLSPKLYRELLGTELHSYELLEIQDPARIPSLADLATRFDGLSITSPHKKHFLNDVIIESPVVRKLGAINTIAFRERGYFATNTDAIAVEKILRNFSEKYKKLRLIILGDGVMARVTSLVAGELGIWCEQYSRKNGDDLTRLDLSEQSQNQSIVINSCFRDFIFQGKLHPDSIFWDYNYSFLPHQESLPAQVKSYFDGQEMLRLQALAAIDFWSAT